MHARKHAVLAAAKQRPHSPSTVTRVPTPSATAGGRMLPEHSTVATRHSNSGHSRGIRGHGRRWHSASALNSGHTTNQQWPQSRHPGSRPVLACSMSTQQWPHDNPTVATVEASVPTAGVGIRPVDSTVATTHSNSGHSYGLRGHGRVRIEPVDSTVATTDCNSGHSSFSTRAAGSARIQSLYTPVATGDCNVTPAKQPWPLARTQTRTHA